MSHNDIVSGLILVLGIGLNNTSLTLCAFALFLGEHNAEILATIAHALH